MNSLQFNHGLFVCLLARLLLFVCAKLHKNLDKSKICKPNRIDDVHSKFVCFFHSLLKHCLRSLFLNRSNLHSVLRVFHCRCYIFHLRECFAIYCTVLYTLYFIVTVDDVVVVAYFLQTKLQSRFSFSCCCRTAAAAVALAFLR